VEFAKRKIQTLSEANGFLKEYRTAFNEKIFIKAEGSSLFVPLNPL
jgi:hypothetical protein